LKFPVFNMTNGFESLSKQIPNHRLEADLRPAASVWDSAAQPERLYRIVMLKIERLGREEAWERDLFMQVSQIGELSEHLLLPSRYFACLLAWDATAVSAD
jgi:hypothetical protein